MKSRLIVKVGGNRSTQYFRTVYSGFLHTYNWLQQYNGTIVESDIKHLKTQPYDSW